MKSLFKHGWGSTIGKAEEEVERRDVDSLVR